MPTEPRTLLSVVDVATVQVDGVLCVGKTPALPLVVWPDVQVPFDTVGYLPLVLALHSGPRLNLVGFVNG